MRMTKKFSPIFFLLLLLHPSHPMPNTPLPPVSLPAPPPTAGGDLSPPRWWGRPGVSSSPFHSPDNNFPLVPREEGSPASAPAPVGAPKEGIPFLSSNPVVPLPTGMTDSASIRPLPNPGDRNQAVGSASSSICIQKLVVVLVMMFTAFCTVVRG